MELIFTGTNLQKKRFFSLDFQFHVEIHFCVIIFDYSHLGKKYLNIQKVQISLFWNLVWRYPTQKFVLWHNPMSFERENKFREMVNAKISSLKVTLFFNIFTRIQSLSLIFIFIYIFELLYISRWQVDYRKVLYDVKMKVK